MNAKKIHTKMLTGFIAVLAIGVILGVVSIISSMSVSSMSSEQEEMQTTSHAISNVVSKHYLWLQELTESVLNGTDFTGSLDSTTCALGTFLSSSMAQDISDAEILSLLNKVKSPHDYIHSNAREVQSLVKSGDLDGAKEYLRIQIIPKTHETIEILTNVSGRYQTLSADHADKIVAYEKVINIVIVALLLISVAAGIILSVVISGGIEKGLESIIDKISMSALNLHSSANQLTDASESLATGSSRQAAAIEQTSATLNQTSSMVSQNAENTRVAAQIATDAADEATEAGKYMIELMNTMSELKESSDKVSKIVKTIDGIAFQTNLLAINATVEAARAGGDAGRSFAVVAQEVRSLAQKSADASSETADIIEMNISLTDSSKDAAERVMSLSQNNAQHITDLGKLIAEIHSASEEQSTGLKQINTAVSQMEKVTQENAAVAEENAAASNSMRDEIDNLDDAIKIAHEMVRHEAGKTVTKTKTKSSPGVSAGKTPAPKSTAAPVVSSPSKPPKPPKPAKPAKTQTAAPAPLPKKSESSPAPAAKTQAPSTTASASGSSTASTKKQPTDAEKIIPLDDNDDF